MPQFCTEKIKAGIFDASQIKQLIKDPIFINLMNEVERKTWISFVEVAENFLSKCKAANYAELINNMLNSFKSLWCNMNIKVNYLHSYKDCFSENLGNTRILKL